MDPALFNVHYNSSFIEYKAHFKDRNPSLSLNKTG